MTDEETSGADKLFREIQEAARAGKKASLPKSNSSHITIPNYSIQEEIQRGGQGVVFKAVQESTKRTVALKLILNGSFATERQRFRFEREIDLASRLNHPNIVTVFDGGISENQPFCAIEFIDGKPLNEIELPSLESTWAFKQLIQLAKKICLAVGYAHSRGVIHRDLKPANILVDQQFEPHILDFGLAKAVQSEINEGFSPRTMTGEFVGTLAYASPEQAQANPELTDTRSDVYALGVVLYELLTGQLPYDVDGSIVETLNNISYVEPKRPTLSNAGLDLDIETILLKSLSKDPERRYQNATLLGQDLERYLNGSPIDARRDSRWYVLKKNVAKHKKVAVTAIAFLSILIGALVAITIFYFQAVEDRNLATSAQQLEIEQRKNAEFRSYIARIAAADASVRIYDTHDVVRNLNNTLPEHRSFEYWYLRNRNNLSLSTMGFADSKRSGHRESIISVDYHPSEDWIVSGGIDGRVVFWDVASGEIIDKLEFDQSVCCIRVHPDGSNVAVGFTKGDVTILNVITNQESGEVTTAPTDLVFSTDKQVLNAIQFTPDGQSLLAACGAHSQAGQVMIFDVSTGKLVQKLDNPEKPVLSLAISADGKLIASGDDTISLWNFKTGKRVMRLDGHKNWITGLSFSPDGKQIASCAYEPEVKLWSVATGDHENSLFGHSSFVNTIAYSPDGKLIATGSRDTTLKFWDAQSGAPISTLWGQYSGIHDLAFSPDGKTVATSGTWCIKTWAPDSKQNQGFGWAYHHTIMDVEVSPDSKRMLACDDHGALAEWELQTQELVERICKPVQPPIAIRSACYSPDGNLIAWANDNGLVYIRDPEQNQNRSFSGHSAQVNSVCFSGDGTTLYSSSEDKSVRAWNVSDGMSTVFCRTNSAVKNALMSPDGRWIVVMEQERIAIHDATNGNCVSEWERQPDQYETKFPLAIHPSSTQLAAPNGKNQLAVWEIPSGKQLASLVDHVQLVDSLAYSPDGKRIATSSREGTIKLWDTERFRVVLTLRGFNGYGEAIAFSPDNLQLVGGIYDGSIRQWKALPLAKRPIE